MITPRAPDVVAVGSAPSGTGSSYVPMVPAPAGSGALGIALIVAIAAGVIIFSKR